MDGTDDLPADGVRPFHLFRVKVEGATRRRNSSSTSRHGADVGVEGDIADSEVRAEGLAAIRADRAADPDDADDREVGRAAPRAR